MNMKQRLQHLLAQREKEHLSDEQRVSSAVLVPIYFKEGQYYVLLIKRTEKVKEHKGQISFPGGAYQEEDKTMVNTALRESLEEIGLKPEDVEVLGEMDDELSITSNYIITPFVGIIPWPYQFKVNEDEVEEIIEAPILPFFSSHRQQQQIKTPESRTVTTFVYHYQGRVIWGATARILNKFLGLFVQAMQS